MDGMEFGLLKKKTENKKTKEVNREVESGNLINERVMKGFKVYPVADH